MRKFCKNLMVYIHPSGVSCLGLLPSLVFFLLTHLSLYSLGQDWTSELPFKLEKRSYVIELGAAQHQGAQYSVGGQIGFLLSPSEPTSEARRAIYFEAVGIGSGREGQTDLMALGSLRIHALKKGSSRTVFIRPFVGYLSRRVDLEKQSELTYGVGAGWVWALHPQMDLNFEARFGMASEPWTMASIGFSLKWDEWVKFYAHKIESLGIKVIETTIDTTQDVLIRAPRKTWDWITDQNQETTTQPSQPPKSSPSSSSEVSPATTP